jgi:hypothetical protein
MRKNPYSVNSEEAISSLPCGVTRPNDSRLLLERDPPGFIAPLTDSSPERKVLVPIRTMQPD